MQDQPICLKSMRMYYMELQTLVKMESADDPFFKSNESMNEWIKWQLLSFVGLKWLWEDLEKYPVPSTRVLFVPNW